MINIRVQRLKYSSSPVVNKLLSKSVDQHNESHEIENYTRSIGVEPNSESQISFRSCL